MHPGMQCSPPRDDDAFMEEAVEIDDPDKGGGQDSSGISGSSKKGGPSGSFRIKNSITYVGFPGNKLPNALC